jgi:hypothetical protein
VAGDGWKWDDYIVNCRLTLVNVDKATGDAVGPSNLKFTDFDEIRQKMWGVATVRSGRCCVCCNLWQLVSLSEIDVGVQEVSSPRESTPHSHCLPLILHVVRNTRALSGAQCRALFRIYSRAELHVMLLIARHTILTNICRL